MAKRDVVVMAASAGGIEALREVLAGVPPRLPAAVLVVLHIPASGGRALAGILDRAGPLPAVAAVDGEALEPGRVHVCVADHHLLVENGRIRLDRGPRENGHRPAADVLFRSAAASLGERVVGVVLSGTLDDGTAGLRAVRAKGGVAIVQDPDDALYGGMPANALRYVGADHIATTRAMGAIIAEVVGTGDDGADEDRPEEASTMAETGDRAIQDGRVPSQWPCPDCRGVLWSEGDEGGHLHFRCRVGHAWSAESLVDRQDTELEAALWVALRTLEDRAALSRTMAQRAEEHGHPLSAVRFRGDLEDLTRSAGVLRHLLEQHGSQVGEHEVAHHG